MRLSLGSRRATAAGDGRADLGPTATEPLGKRRDVRDAATDDLTVGLLPTDRQSIRTPGEHRRPLMHVNRESQGVAPITTRSRSRSSQT